MSEDLKSFFKSRKTFLQEEIQLQMEVIRLHLDELECELNAKLDDLFDTKEINEYSKDYAKQIEFVPNFDYLESNLVGKIVHKTALSNTFSLKELKSIKSMQNFDDYFVSPRFLAYDSLDDSIFYTDSQSKSLIKLDSNGNYSCNCSIKIPFKSPEGICLTMNSIFIGDADLNLIFELKKSTYEIAQQFGNKHLRKPRGLDYDAESGELYVCDNWSKQIKIFNKYGQLRDEFGLNEAGVEFYPWNVKLFNKRIYVTDDWVGGNCIRVFDKKKFNLVQSISHLNVWNPRGLFVSDQSETIWTCGNLHYENGSLNLFNFNKQGELLYQIDLNLNLNLLDFCFAQKNFNLLFSTDKKLHVCEFK